MPTCCKAESGLDASYNVLVAPSTTVTPIMDHSKDPPPAPSHPYYPAVVSLQHFTANETPVAVLIAAFGGIIAPSVLASVAVARKARPSLSNADQLAIAWFALCGFLHCVFEAYFIFNHGTLASLQTLFGQLWKEYALSDSRYLTSDPFVFTVELITVFVWGPLCWAIVMSIARGSQLRHPLTIVMCVGHLYGVALYYLTSMSEYYLNGVSHSRPEFLYFWIYYIGFNAPWVVVPGILLHKSVLHVKRGLESLERLQPANTVSKKVD
ncbi:3-beta-hydroxysteroid-Delta(8),Delta(7)-isomerase [Colletotrichum sidae]|uniref:3-beta-hydroxysteroid-Delta(8), Delta(7)-isomerase n=1 Tax=Colletotrichum sidae TaxID=1347389 RepID=A0A4R8S7E3_9PEZI|nr:3-beta-hydroxysteroid-Delta(8),Delta(7)-isomerase [Colletotrichum sidae]